MKKNNRKYHYKNPLAAIIITALFSLFMFHLQRQNFLKQIQLQADDVHFRIFNQEALADTNIVLLAIDDNSLQFSRQNRVPWPWPRSFYAQILHYLKSGGAKKVLFDIQFYEPDLDRSETYAEETDSEFASAIEETNNVILGTLLKEDSTAFAEELLTLGKHENIPQKYSRSFMGALSPITTFLEANPKIGIINIEPDEDAVIRRIPLFFELNGVNYYSFPLSAISPPLKLSLNSRNMILLDNSPLSTDRNGNYILNWYGEGGADKTFTYYSIGAVLASIRDLHMKHQPQISPSIFKDKYVIIGATAGGLMDLKTTPVSKVYPGMEIWATALSNLLNGHHVNILPDWLNYILILIFTLLCYLSQFHIKSWISNLVFVFLLIFVFIIDYLLWNFYRIQFPLIILIFSVTGIYLLVITFKYLIEDRDKRKMKNLFSRYLDTNVIDDMLNQSSTIELGGEEIEATVLFTDIANFTTFSEDKTPKELAALLNSYFTKLTDFILKYSGLLDKFTGDGIMALFGPPRHAVNHAELACRAAIEHRDYCRSLSADSNPEANFHIHTRFGINSGSLVAGNIGSVKRMDYTAIGDTVNTSARLEGVNKIYGTSVMLSESTYKLVKDQFICRKLDCIKVKGRNEPIFIYELLAEVNDENREKYCWIKTYEDAWQLYFDKKWAEAKDIFEKLIIEKNDCVAKVMLDRCAKLINSSPNNWDGVLKLEVK
ncbi:MAG: CHASE2 domain-containing protein [Candidatus Cloacimonetes bacterium]|nr:CHASE2 domain-containing protein [Candidatus Cloacimonadota bacterium]